MNERKSFQIQKNIADNKNMIYGNKKEFYQQYNKKKSNEVSKKDIKSLKNKNGITLIALVISIIVMLILAGVSLNATIGDNGIITQAQNAKQAQEDAVFNEKKESILFNAYNMKEEGKSDEEIESYLKEAFSDVGDRVVVSKVGEDWLIVCDGRIVRSKLDGKTENNLISKDNIGTSEEWTVLYDEQGYLTIIGSSKTTGNVNIPEVITYEKTDGTECVGSVKQIGEEGYNVFSYRVGITSVTIPEGVQVIYNNAFYECSGLSQEINFPSTLTTIGEYAFYNCSGLTGNIIEKLENSNVTSVGSYAFYGCKELTGELKLFNNIKMGAMTLAKCEKITGDINLLLSEGLTEIPDGAFSGMSGLTGMPNIPTTVTRIGNDAFNNCSGLTGTLAIPSVCEEIGDRAFYRCRGFNLLSWDTSNSGKLKSIGTRAFEGCNGFANNDLSFPNLLENLGKYSFRDCSKISGNLYLPNNISDIQEGTFWAIGCTNLILSNNTQSFGQACFVISKITTIQFNNKIKTIGQQVFQGTQIENLAVPDSLEILGPYAFYACSKLKNLTINSKLTSIGSFCFANCTNLEKLGNSNNNIIEYLQSTNVKAVGDSAFESCQKLTGTFYNKLITKAGNCTIGSSIFNKTGVVVTINLADGLELKNDGTYLIKKSAYAGATNFTGNVDLSNIRLDNGEIAVISEIGYYAFYGCNQITSVTIPNTVKGIGNYAFAKCDKLTTVKLSDSLTQISSDCFANCGSLMDITLPEEITKIQARAFQNCGLVNITIPNKVTEIQGSAFEGNFKLEKIVFNKESELTTLGTNTFLTCKKLQEVILPKSISKIGGYAFKSCDSLKKVDLKDITIISEGMFWNCTNLKEVLIKDTTKIQSIGDSAFYNCTPLNLKLTLPSNASIGKDAFKDSNGNTLSGIKLEFIN